LLAAFRHLLMEVPLWVHEADADQRKAKVARFFAVITGQHAKSARIDGQRLVDRELGGEIRDQLTTGSIKLVGPPARPGSVALRIELGHRGIIDSEKPPIACHLLQRLGRHAPQHAHRVVRG
jgi:hypothetical protein